MNISILFAALSGQLLSETTPLTLEAAEVVLARELEKCVTDQELLKSARMMLFTLKGTQKLDVDHVNLVIKNIIKKHYLDPSGSTNPLSEALHKVGISDSDAHRIFYLEHDDAQDEGWSCGFRAIFNASSLQKQLRSGLPVLSSHKIGHTSLNLREKKPGLAGAIEYIILRSKLNEVCALLQKDENLVDEALWLLHRDHPDMLNVFLQLQSDYFIHRVALRLLATDTNAGTSKGVSGKDRPDIIDAIAVLGKSSHKAFISVGDELVKLVVKELEKPGLSVRFDAIMRELYAAIPDQKGLSGRELTTFISWGADVAVNRYKIVRFVLTTMHPGLSAMGRHVRELCSATPQVKVFLERAKNELTALGDLLDISCISAIREKLNQAVDQKFIAAQDQMCAIDDQLGSISRAIDNCACSKIAVALALFYSRAECDNDDIVDLLKSSTCEGIDRALAHINEDEHAKIQACIAKLTGLLDLLDNNNEGLLGIHKDLDNELSMAQGIVRGMQSEVTKLRNRLSKPVSGGPNLVSNLDTALREARDLLKKADSQRIVEAFRILLPHNQISGASNAHSVDRVKELLAQLKDPLVKQAVDILECAQTQEAALAATSAIEIIQSIPTEEALVLLRSDHRSPQWGNSFMSNFVKNRITAIKGSSPQEGQCADPDHLLKLARMPDLELPPENVHILGDFTHQGLLFDTSDGIFGVLRASERDRIERSETKIEQSERVISAIRDHFQKNYLDKDVTGAHYFICNVKRPSEHWVKVALVKIKGKKPILVLLDSMNYSIRPDKESKRVGVDTVLAFLYNAFLRPLNSPQK